MRMERICQNLLLAVLLGGLAACESDKDVVGANSPDESSAKPLGVDTTGLLSSQFVGKWMYRDSGATELQKWQVEMKENGLYVTCDLLHRTNGARVDTIKPFACDSGVWSDLGNVSMIYGDLGALLADPTKHGAMLNESRLVMIKWMHPVDPLRPRFDHPEGLLFSPSGDSLVSMGSFGIFQGTGRRLDSTLWRHPGGLIDSLFLAANSVATARVEGISGKTGLWLSDSKSMDLSFTLDKSSDGSFRSARAGGRLGFLGSHLILLAPKNPVGFRKVADAGR